MNDLLITPHFESIPSERTLIGIGTLIRDETLERTQNRAWYGTGYGYTGNKQPDLSNLGHVYGVRGLLSTSKLGLDATMAIGDPGYLVACDTRPWQVKFAKWSYMPHWLNHSSRLQKEVERQGIYYINPTCANPKSTIMEINLSMFLLTEAMHGAIIADALRVPWFPVFSKPVNTFKWNDWLSTSNLELVYEQVVKHQPLQAPTFKQKLTHAVRCHVAARQLRRLTTTVKPMLTSDQWRDATVSRLVEVRDQIKSDLSEALESECVVPQ